MTRSASTRRRILMATSIAPAPRPPLWLPLIVMAIGMAPMVGLILWAWCR